MGKVDPLTADQLYTYTDISSLYFETTNDLDASTEIIGQPRAVDAIQFGIGIKKDGVNMFALGPEGSGKRAFITQFFLDKAQQEKVPPDWIYVQNFDHDFKPLTRSACQLAGTGSRKLATIAARRP